jgi:hypothetical protein
MRTEIETNPEVVRLTAMLVRWDKSFPDDRGDLPADLVSNDGQRYKPHMRDTLKRRIFAAIHEIEFTNPFNKVDEWLYKCWR